MQEVKENIEEQYWQAVVEKDSRANDTFFVAVRTTGVYCKPSCPSRRPKRENVSFYTSPEAAEQAGYRACKRCHPRESAQADPQVEIAQRISRYIEQHLEGAISLADLSEQFNISPFHLQRIFKRVMGISPRQYAEAYRLDQFKTQLKERDSVTAALYEVGYSSSSRLYERAPGQLGMTPTTYQRGGAGMQISYTIVDSPLGRLLVAATEKGICSVCIGDEDSALEKAFQNEYPMADISHDIDGTPLHNWVETLVKHLNGQQPHLDLPLDVQATAFQRRVWQALQAIPYGETRSYSQIAQTIGHPTAARAVANACATNPVAIAVPCHRVVRENGNMGGYRWGKSRKQQLLEQEAEHIL